MADALVSIHAVAALATLLALTVAAGWGVVDFLEGAQLSRRYDRVLWGVQAVLMVQVAAGIGAVLLARWPAAGRHLVYGSVASLLPWGVWLVVRHHRRVSLHMAITCALAVVLGVAAVVTAS